MKKLMILFCLIGAEIFGQVDMLKDFVNPAELVSFSEKMPYDKAMMILNGISQGLGGKSIQSETPIKDAIGIQIDKMNYRKALNLIARMNNMDIVESKSSIQLRSRDGKEKPVSSSTYAASDEREVKISAVFFEANVKEMRERGINWQWLLSGDGVNIGSEVRTFTLLDDESASNTAETPPDFTLSTETEFKAGSFQGDAISAFRFFEDENMGEIIAKPSIAVRNTQKGRIQIGSDISVKQRDFAGNVIDVFYSTGTIIEVTPYVYEDNGLEYCLLKLAVERSSAQPDIVSTEIRKTMASTDVLMLNGEETVIGGLYVTETKTIRKGIPVLKDLPWWVFGIKYLTGYDEYSLTKKEVIILIKADILPTLKERIAGLKERRNLVKEQYEKDEADAAEYSIKNSEGEDK